LSTLTKILIVLLTFSVIILCPIVVTYVANTENYRQKYVDLRAERDSLSRKTDSLTRQLNEKIEQNQQQQQQLNDRLASIQTEMKKLQTDLSGAEREKAALMQKVNTWTSVVEDFTSTNEQQAQLLKEKLQELKDANTELVRQRKELQETTAALVEKMAIIDALQAETMQLREEKADLQARLDQMLLPVGKVAAPPTPVTQTPGQARPARRLDTEKIALSGLVKAVDLKNSMASISLGSADGVKVGMKFHVTRADKFLCDILVIDVDTEQAVGVLELIQQPPQAGDSVSTNL